MGNLDHKPVTRRRRPHISTIDATLFLTFRLAGSIPKATLRFYRAKLNWLQSQIKQHQLNSALKSENEFLEVREWLETLQREWFSKTEEMLHRTQDGPKWMSESVVAEKVADNLHRLDGEAYRLDAFSIMSNHVHTVFNSESEFLTLIRWDGLTPINEHPSLSKIMHSQRKNSAGV